MFDPDGWMLRRSGERAIVTLAGTLLIVAGALLLTASAGYYLFSLKSKAGLALLNQRLDASDATASLFPEPRLYEVRRMYRRAGRIDPSVINPLRRSLAVAGLEPGLAESALAYEERYLADLLYLPTLGGERIVVPSIDVDSPVVEIGTKYEDGELVWETASHAVGHLRGTSNPGDVGNVVMAGHISSPTKGEGNVFSRLPKIQLGEEVSIFTPLGRYDYQVVETRVVLPTEVSVIEPTSEPILTLITCVPDWVYTHRLIVTAKPVGYDPTA